MSHTKCFVAQDGSKCPLKCSYATGKAIPNFLHKADILKIFFLELPRLAKRYKVPLEIIADGNGERLRGAGGVSALLK